MSRFEQLINAITDPVFELDTEGNIVYATPALAAWTGREFSPTSHYPFADILGQKDRTRFNQALKRVVDGKTLKTAIPLELNAKNATAYGAVELTLIALPSAADMKSRGAGRKAISIAGYLRDGRAEKKAEAATNLQSAHLLDLVENITDACVVETADGSVEMVNAAFCELFAIDVAPQSWVATSCASLFELASMVVNDNAGPIYTRQSDQAQSTTTIKLGGKKISHTMLAIMHDDNDPTSATGFAGRLHLFKLIADVGTDARAGGDSTDQGAATSATNYATSHATSHATSRVQLQFVERIRADLGATIEAAFHAIHHAEQVELSDRALEQFRRVEASAHSAVIAIAGLVDLADDYSDHITLETAPFRLRESTAGLLNILVPRAAELGIAISLRLEQDVPETIVGDGTRLMMALRHLIELGFENDKIDSELPKRTGAKIALTVQPEYTDNNIIHLSFTVEHTAADAQTDSTSITTMRGMQLALARQISRALSATTKDSENGTKTGSSAEPRSRQDIEIVQKQNRISAAASHTTSYKFTAPFPFTTDENAHARPAFVTLTGMHVLLVSADPHERARLAELVRNWRMLPAEADDAAMALQLLNRMAEEKNEIPLVITSNQLPLQDGFLLAFRVKQHAKLKNTNVIMLAKNGRPGDAIQCRENGISAYLRDPISPDQLVDAIGAVMGTKDDAEATHTLITRHSLREAKTGTVLLIDAHHDQATLAATFLKRRDFRVVVVDNAKAAAELLSQDIFDVIIADALAAGFDSKLSIAQQLRLNFPEGADMPILLAMNDFAKVDAAEYQGVITKPYEKTALLEKVASVMMAKTTVAKSRRSNDPR
jgi:DNA-binding response OmpR family regulator/PAS domain-containing protein